MKESEIVEMLAALPFVSKVFPHDWREQNPDAKPGRFLLVVPIDTTAAVAWIEANTTGHRYTWGPYRMDRGVLGGKIGDIDILMNVTRAAA